MPSGKVSISIVNFNRKNMLAECLASVQAESYPDIEVVVVDNASSDGSAEMVEERFPGVRLVRCDSNLLFCKGQNTGIANTSGEYVLVLNNDVVLDKDFVMEAVAAAEPDGALTSFNTSQSKSSRSGQLDPTPLRCGVWAPCARSSDDSRTTGGRY